MKKRQKEGLRQFQRWRYKSVNTPLLKYDTALCRFNGPYTLSLIVDPV